MSSKFVDGKLALQKALAPLLGMDIEGASDLLEHLLSIDSREDLLEYMTQLFGEESEVVIDFVNNVGRYQRGEPLQGVAKEEQGKTIPSTDLSKEQTVGPPKQQNNNQNQQQTSLPKRNNPNTNSNTANTANQGRRNVKKQPKSRVPPPAKSKVPPPKKSLQQKQQAVSLATTTKSTTTTTTAAKPTKATPVKQEESRQKIRPTRGKATIVCGCYGTVHKPLTNCLYCGRISCSQEGYDFCPFCGFMVDQVVDHKRKSHAGNLAWEQKERLLQFDRDFASRTKIVDDQADYQVSNSIWLRKEDQLQQDQLAEQQSQIGKRKLQTLQLNI